MKCTYCNLEQEENFSFCPQCGAPVEEEPPRENEVAKRLIPAVKSGKFLAICILLSVSLGCTLLAGSMDLLTLLAMIFMWQVYADARKNILNARHVRCVSGTVYAAYILNYVAAGLLILSAVMLTGALAMAGNVFQEALDAMHALSITVPPVFSILLAAPLILCIFLGVWGVGYTVLNFLGLGSIHVLIKNTYQGLSTGVFAKMKAAKAACTWLLIFGIFTAIDAASSLFNFELWSGFAAGCNATVYILASTLAKQFLNGLENKK